MANDDFDLQEVARLVNGLAPERRPPTPGRRWTNARLHMPEQPAAVSRRTFAWPWDFQWPAWLSFGFPALAVADWNVFQARMWVGLGVAFSASMLYWPYAVGSAWGLLWYLCAVLLVVVSGVWGAKLTWDARLGGAHTFAVGTMVWGMMLAAVELLPRIGWQG
jgi:hypothetical protein